MKADKELDSLKKLQYIGIVNQFYPTIFISQICQLKMGISVPFTGEAPGLSLKGHNVDIARVAAVRHVGSSNFYE